MTEIICTKCGGKCGFMEDTRAISLLLTDNEAAWREVNNMRNQRDMWRILAVTALIFFASTLVSL